MTRLRCIAVCFIYIQAIFLILPSPFVQAATLADSMHAAADHFSSFLQSSDSTRKIHLTSVIHLTSKTEDKLGSRMRETLVKELRERNVEIVFDKPAESTDNAYSLSGAYIIAGSRIILKLSLCEGQTIYSKFEAEWPAERADPKSRLVVLNISGDAIPEETKQALSRRYRARLCENFLKKEPGQVDECTGHMDDSADIREIVSTHVFSVDNDSYLVFSKATDRKSETILRSKTIEHHGSIDSIDESLDIMADLMSEGGGDLPLEQESFIERSKWHFTAVSIAAFSLLMIYDETSRYYDLSAENSGIRTQYLLATAQDDITRLKSEYNDNAGKMDQLEERINLMTLVATLAVGWESYLLYKTYKDNTAAEGDNSKDG